MELPITPQPPVMARRNYRLSRWNTPDAAPQAELFEPEAYCQAVRKWTQACRRDLQRPRTATAGRWFPCSQLDLISWDTEGNEVELRTLEENHSYAGREATREPLAEELLAARNAGHEWFEQDGEFNRAFFVTEPEAIEFGRNAHDAEWTLYNLERYLEALEGNNIQCFLRQRSALSTNRLEELAGLGRGTLSKIKNGQRKLSRRQYPRLMRILPHYGYQAHVDLRLIDPPLPISEVDPAAPLTE
ncbi:MAG: helix-turn-helix transcriptional regulator [Bacteroidota bacterium]